MNGLCFPWNWLAWGAVLALPACAPPSPPPAPAASQDTPLRSAASACNASLAQAAVGQLASPALAEAARQQAGARSVRVIGHDDMVTKEYDTSRLNLQLDLKGRVTRVYCG